VFDGTTSDFEVRNSWFANNGWPEGSGHGSNWADGLTLNQCLNGWVHDNHFIDNTDVDLVTGGTGPTAWCALENNIIDHSQWHGFAGIHVGWFPGAGNGDGLTASLTLQSVPDATGTWSGRTVVIEDVRVSGAGPFRPSPGLVTPISFTLQQQGASLSGDGVVDLTPGSVEGTIRSTGRITLKGTFENAEGYHVEITESPIDLDSAGYITGQFTMTQRFVNAWGPQVIRTTRQILSLTRQ
jgi:hypothetical protein